MAREGVQQMSDSPVRCTWSMTDASGHTWTAENTDARQLGFQVERLQSLSIAQRQLSIAQRQASKAAEGNGEAAAHAMPHEPARAVAAMAQRSLSQKEAAATARALNEKETAVLHRLDAAREAISALHAAMVEDWQSR